MNYREEYNRCYRAAREALNEAALRGDECFSIVLVPGAASLAFQVEVFKARFGGEPLVRCIGQLADAVAATLRGRGVAAFSATPDWRLPDGAWLRKDPSHCSWDGATGWRVAIDPSGRYWRQRQCWGNAEPQPANWQRVDFG